MCVVIGLLGVPAAEAAPVPSSWHAPRPWLYQAWCLHDGLRRDSHGRVLYRVSQGEGAWNADTGNGYFGGLQFLPSTWRRVGGTTLPNLVSPREQLYRAWLVWRQDGGSFREWGTARACGLD